MKQVIEIFKQLQNTSSKNAKEEIIAKNKDNELFKQCLVFLLDDNIQTGIKSKSLKKNIKCDGDIVLVNSWEKCMEYFKENNTGKDYDILVAQGFINYKDEEDREFYEQMITKSLKVGVQASTVNKVIPNLIFEWKIQLGFPQEKLRLKDEEVFFLSKKMNGFRGTYYNGQFLSRQGKKIDGLQHIINDIKALQLDTFFIDGELIRKNPENLDDNTNFRLSASIINTEEVAKPDIEFVVFDIFPAKAIINGEATEVYSDRKQRMLDIQKSIQEKNIQNIKIVEMVYEGSDKSEIEKWSDKAATQGWEGLVLNKNIPYEFKRSTGVIKIKQFKEIALRCTGVNISDEGKYKGVMSSIECKYFDWSVDCGSGFSDEDRVFYAEYPETIVGQIVSIKYKDESQNKDGGQSIQFPRFLGIRTDKSIPDDEEE